MCWCLVMPVRLSLVFFSLVCILPFRVWRLDSTPTVHPDSFRCDHDFHSVLVGGRKKRRPAHRIQLTAQQILEKKISNSEVSSVDCTWLGDASSFSLGVFSPMSLPTRLVHLLGVTEQNAAPPGINVEQPDAWQVVCGALLLQTGRAHLETH